MNFNKEEFSLFREEIKKAVEKVEKKFDVEIKFGAISYTESDFTIKTTVFKGSAKESNEVMFSNICTLYGLEKEDFGKVVTHKNKDYKISGIDPKKRKYPIMATSEDGETILFTEEAVKKMLNKNNN